ncbi:hypothetical protein D3C81_1456730 [compost metagenome]
MNRLTSLDRTHMNRRGLLGAGVLVAVAGVSLANGAQALTRTVLEANNGRRVTLRGVMAPSSMSAVHYFTIQGVGVDDQVRVFLRDGRDRPAGRTVSLEGRLQLGKFQDAVTNDIARAVLLDARFV